MLTKAAAGGGSEAWAHNILQEAIGQVERPDPVEGVKFDRLRINRCYYDMKEWNPSRGGEIELKYKGSVNTIFSCNNKSEPLEC